MRILMIAPQPFLEPRGTPISVYQRLVGLASLGHVVDLLTYHLGEDVDITGVTVHRIPSVPLVRSLKAGPSWAKLVLDIVLICKAITMLITRHYDLIHSHEEAAFFSMVLAAVFRIRHLYDMHSSLPRQLAAFHFGGWSPVVRLFELMERLTIRTCDALITIDSDLRQLALETDPSVEAEVIENLPIQAFISATEHSTVDELKQRLGLNGRFLIVYTGSLGHYQGVDLVLQAAEIVRQQHPEALFLFVGGRRRHIEYWKKKVVEHGVGDCVRFLGSVSVNDIGAYLNAAEILVSPRLNGTSVPLKIYSYLYSGRPIVATDLPSHTAVLSDETAVLVAVKKEAMAEGILKLIRSPELRLRMGRRAQELAYAQCGSGQYMVKLDRIYRTLQVSDCASVQSVKASLES